jgi:hypothetical protein
MNQSLQYFTSLLGSKFQNEPMWKWFIFLAVSSSFLVAWASVIRFMREEV